MIDSMRPPPWQIEQWLNTDEELSLENLKGRAIFVLAFQMLCPGCVSQALPQAQRVRATFPDKDLVVIGLHCVFEHHAAQGHTAALAAFMHEYRIAIPIGIDASAAAGKVPATMQAYRMQGTPTILVYDRSGKLVADHFGHFDDLRLGAMLMSAADTERK